MDKQELIWLLTSQRSDPIFVCRIRQDIATAIGASDTAVWLSAETIKKQESKHKHPDLELYRLVPSIVEKGYVRISPPQHAIFIFHDKREKTRSYKAVIKATQNGHRLYLASIHRVSRGDVRAVFRKTDSLKEWKRKLREVGPPKNPT